MVGWSRLILGPFLLIAGGVNYWLPGDYNIKHDLNERPSEFRIVLAIASILVNILIGLLRVYSVWFLALVLFDQVQRYAEATSLFQGIAPGFLSG